MSKQLGKNASQASRSAPGSRMASKRPSKAVVEETTSSKDLQGKLTDLTVQLEKEKEQRNLMQLERVIVKTNTSNQTRTNFMDFGRFKNKRPRIYDPN